jgi:hypothetical protein
LRPKLAYLESVGDALPELLDSHSEGRARSGCWLGTGCHWRLMIIEERLRSVF